MLEIKRGIAIRSYENTFFREFASNLSNMFDKYSLDGLLIANSECPISPNLQIDILLVTQHTVCIIDLKNFGGEIVLPIPSKDFSSGTWVTNSGDKIKGGSHINPYKQLLWQKKAFSWVYHNSLLKEEILKNNDSLNPSHVKKIVCFQKPVTLSGTIPTKDEIDFFITDSDRYLETVKDILDVKDEDINLSHNSLQSFTSLYLAEPFDITETYGTDAVEQQVEIHTPELNFEKLYPTQKAAIQEVSNFLQSDTDKIFILQGTSLSGKTHLLPYIKDIAFDNQFEQVEYFATSTRVTNNLLSDSELKFNTVYSYIYGGSQFAETEDQKKQEEKSDKTIKDESEINLDIVPLKKSQDEDKALFIIDEAQLISDSYYQSIDLRFGTGKLLQDLMSFIDVTNTKRKVIFVGDNYQISLGKKEENSLNPSHFIEKYALYPKIFQLLDNPLTPIIQQALIPVSGIRSQSYNSLQLTESNNLQLIEKQDVLNLLKTGLSKTLDFHILTFSNLEAQKVNLWIKKQILKNGSDLAEKDLLIINNNFSVKDRENPFSDPKRIFNGQFAIVKRVENNTISETITPKGKSPVTLNFRELDVTMADTGHSVTMLSLENYRLSEKGELSENEIIALKIIINRELGIVRKQKPFKNSPNYQQLIHSKEHKKLEKELKELKIKKEQGDKVKIKIDKKERELRKLSKKYERQYNQLLEKELLKDTSSIFFKYKNCAQLRFGWTLTVHKSVSYKWSEALFNVSQGENAGRTNKNYFKWIYTGITRAKDKISLINYEAISPLYKAEFKDNCQHKVTRPSKNFYLITEKDTKLDTNLINQFQRKYGEADEKFIATIYQLYQSISHKLKDSIKIKSIRHSNYQEIYEFENELQQNIEISFYYNGKGQIKPPTIIRSSNTAGNHILSLLMDNNKLDNFDFILDNWRKNFYESLSQALLNNGGQINCIIQNSYNDRVTITREARTLTIDMYYNADGFFTKIISFSYNDISVWRYFQKILIDLT